VQALKQPEAEGGAADAAAREREPDEVVGRGAAPGCGGVRLGIELLGAALLNLFPFFSVDLPEGGGVRVGGRRLGGVGELDVHYFTPAGGMASPRAETPEDGGRFIGI
jgi:hypothetical protein